MSSTTSKSTTRESSSTILMSSATTKSNPRTRSSGMRSNQTTNLDVIHFSSTPSPNPLAVKFSATTVGSIQPISSTVKGIFTGVTSWPTYLSSRKDSTSQRMHVTIQSTSSAARKDSSTSKSDFTKKHSSLAKGSVDAAGNMTEANRALDKAISFGLVSLSKVYYLRSKPKS